VANQVGKCSCTWLGKHILFPTFCDKMNRDRKVAYVVGHIFTLGIVWAVCGVAIGAYHLGRWIFTHRPDSSNDMPVGLTKSPPLVPSMGGGAVSTGQPSSSLLEKEPEGDSSLPKGGSVVGSDEKKTASDDETTKRREDEPFQVYEGPFPENISPEQREGRVRAGDLNIQARIKRHVDRADAAGKAQTDGDKELSSSCSEAQIKGNQQVLLGYDIGTCGFAGRRGYMEDEVLIGSCSFNGEPVLLLGVFDAHSPLRFGAGRFASGFLKDNLIKKLNEAFSSMSLRFPGQHDVIIWNALKIVFVELSHDLVIFERSLIQGIRPSMESGSTAIIALIIEKKLWIANVGDSRAILTFPGSKPDCNNATYIQLSEDAKPINPYFAGLYRTRGGKVQEKDDRFRGSECSLNMARSIGDRDFKPFLSARPKITRFPLREISPNSRLILACDGVWDVASSRQVAQFVQEKTDANTSISPRELAESIVSAAFYAGSSDNLTALVTTLNPQSH
jgi:serine/threonine protein phosphatase PrpC